MPASVPLIWLVPPLFVAAVAASAIHLGPPRPIGPRARHIAAVTALATVLLAACTSGGNQDEAGTTGAADASSGRGGAGLGEPPELADAARTDPRHFAPLIAPQRPPAQLPPMDVTGSDAMQGGTVTFTTYTDPRMTPGTAFYPSFLVELDKAGGDLVKVQRMLTSAAMFQPEPDGRYSYNIVDSEGVGGAGIEVSHYVTDDRLGILATYNLDDLEGGDADLHDFELLDNGNAMLLAYRKREVDLTAFGGVDDALVWDTVIAERTPDGETVWEWDGAEHMDFADVPDAEAQAQLTVEPPAVADYAHPNSLEILDDGDVVVSIRHYDCTYRIDKDSGDIVWTFGGANCRQNDFEISGDPLDGPSHQHDVTVLDDGNLLMFDNGNLRSGEQQVSRVVEYAIDEEAMTAELVWSHDDDRYTAIMGSAERLDNGNTLIGWGELTEPAITEVTPDGDGVFSVSLPDGQLVYRAYQGHAER